MKYLLISSKRIFYCVNLKMQINSPSSDLKHTIFYFLFFSRSIKPDQITLALNMMLIRKKG